MQGLQQLWQDEVARGFRDEVAKRYLNTEGPLGLDALERVGWLAWGVVAEGLALPADRLAPAWASGGEQVVLGWSRRLGQTAVLDRADVRDSGDSPTGETPKAQTLGATRAAVSTDEAQEDDEDVALEVWAMHALCLAGAHALQRIFSPKGAPDESPERAALTQDAGVSRTPELPRTAELLGVDATHVTDARLLALFGGRLGALASASLVRHATGCVPCDARLALLAMVRGAGATASSVSNSADELAPVVPLFGRTAGPERGAARAGAAGADAAAAGAAAAGAAGAFPIRWAAAAASDDAPMRDPEQGVLVAESDALGFEVVYFEDGQLAVYTAEATTVRFEAEGVGTEQLLPGYWLGSLMGAPEPGAKISGQLFLGSEGDAHPFEITIPKLEMSPI